MSDLMSDVAGTFYCVYYKKYLTKSLRFLGLVEERRKKERTNNRRDLMRKARKNFANRVKDPYAIFVHYEESGFKGSRSQGFK